MYVCVRLCEYEFIICVMCVLYPIVAYLLCPSECGMCACVWCVGFRASIRCTELCLYNSYILSDMSASTVHVTALSAVEL